MTFPADLPADLPADVPADLPFTGAPSIGASSPPPGGSDPPSGGAPPPPPPDPPPSSPPPRRFHRSTDDRVVGGVCSGFARWSGIDVTVVRLVTVLFMLLGHGLLLYAAAWLLLPDGETGPSAFDRHRARFRERRRVRAERHDAPRPMTGWEPPAGAAA